ncbi:DUF2846 domain-containing protein [Porticoccaceae bacterium LTM1]|nr:DUF2846 domain-containing protein [Porticoccaceae bacterium LTM1]
MRLIAFMPLLLLLASCASSPVGEPFAGIESHQSDKAIVYVFRKSAFPGSARDTNIFVNGKVELALSNGSYGILRLSGGEYTFGAKNIPGWQYVEGHPIETKFNVKAGGIYYLMFTKQFDVSAGTKEKVFITNSEMEINTGVLEGGLLDSSDVIGFVTEEFAIEQLKKTKKTGLQVDQNKI